MGQPPPYRTGLAAVMGVLWNSDNEEKKRKAVLFFDQSRLICGSFWRKEWNEEDYYVCDRNEPRSKGFLGPRAFQTADCSLLLVGVQHFGLDCDQHLKNNKTKKYQYIAYSKK